MFIRRMFSSSFEYFVSLSTSFSKSDIALFISASVLTLFGIGRGVISRSRAFEVRLALQHLHELDALPSLQKELIAVGGKREPLHDRGEHADLRQIFGARILFVALLLAERRDQVLIVGERLEQADVAIDADLQRKDAAREEDRGDERDDRQPVRNFLVHPVGYVRTDCFTSCLLCHLV